MFSDYDTYTHLSSAGQGACFPISLMLANNTLHVLEMNDVNLTSKWLTL